MRILITGRSDSSEAILRDTGLGWARGQYALHLLRRV